MQQRLEAVNSQVADAATKKAKRKLTGNLRVRATGWVDGANKETRDGRASGRRAAGRGALGKGARTCYHALCNRGHPCP